MKTNIKIVIQSIGILLAFTIIGSLVFAGLYNFHVIDTTLYHNLNWIFGAIAYLIAGLFLGYHINKKALLHAFIIIVILGIISMFMLPSYTLLSILKLSSKLLCYVLGCIVSISKKP